MYAARFYRPREVWREAWIECDGVRINYRLSHENGAAILCRALQALGRPDGGFVAREVGVNPQYALVHRYESMHELAKPYTPEPHCGISTSLYADLAKIATGASWSAITHQHDLVGRDLVVLAGDTVTLTELGQERMAAYKAAQEVGIPSVVLTVGQREAFAIVTANEFDKWDGLHSRTRNFMVAAGWVQIENGRPVLTGFGQDIWHKVTRDDPEVISAPAFIDLTLNGKPIRVSFKQRDALHAVNATPAQWGAVVHPKTRGFLLNAKWVVVNDGMAALTTTGQQVANACAAI